MAAPYQLKKRAAERNQSIAQMLDEVITAEGSVAAAARAINVNPWSIRRWLNRNSFTVKPHLEAVHGGAATQ